MAIPTHTAPLPTAVLLATDFSARCDRALDRAIMLCRQWQARLVIAHVLETPLTGGTEDDQNRQRVKLEQRLAAELADSGVQFSPFILTGKPADALLHLASEQNVGLIVTGMARYNGLSEFVTGTIVDKLARKAAVPVLVVKTRPRRPYGAIVAGTDFSGCSAAAIFVAEQWFPDLPIDAVHGWQVPYQGMVNSASVRADIMAEVQEEMDAFVADLAAHQPALRCRVHLHHGPTIEVVEAAAAVSGADLAVLGTHGRGRIAAAMLGSKALQLLQYLPIDVLLVRE